MIGSKCLTSSCIGLSTKAKSDSGRPPVHHHHHQQLTTGVGSGWGTTSRSRPSLAFQHPAPPPPPPQPHPFHPFLLYPQGQFYGESEVDPYCYYLPSSNTTASGASSCYSGSSGLSSTLQDFNREEVRELFCKTTPLKFLTRFDHLTYPNRIVKVARLRFRTSITENLPI